MRAFVKLRGMLASHKELTQRLDEMEQRYDSQFKAVFQTIRQLREPPPAPPRRRIGFKTES